MKKSRIRETANLLTNADKSTHFFCCLLKKKFNPEQLLVYKALQVGPQMHQSTSRTPPTSGPSMGAIWNNSSFLRLYKSVDECTSLQVKHLPCVTIHVCNPKQLLVFRALSKCFNIFKQLFLKNFFKVSSPEPLEILT